VLHSLLHAVDRCHDGLHKVPVYSHRGIGDSPKARYDVLLTEVRVPGLFCDEIIAENRIPIEKIAQDTLEHKNIGQQWYALGRKNSVNGMTLQL